MNAQDQGLEPWRDCWRRGVGPALPTEGLVALRDALRADDQRLIQGSTTLPEAVKGCETTPTVGACPVAFAGWRAQELDTVERVHEFFGYICTEADQALGESGGCRHFINAVDSMSRDQMRALLLPEVEMELARRAS